MTLKHLIIAAVITLFSPLAISAGTFHLRVQDLNVDDAANNLSKGALLGNGWQTFTPDSDDYMCEAMMPAAFNYYTAQDASLAGVSDIRDGSVSYPVYRSNRDDIGYVIGVRQSGTSAWYPVTPTETAHRTVSDTTKVHIEVRFAMVKLVEGEVRNNGNNRVNFQSFPVRCGGSGAIITYPMGLILPGTSIFTWKPKSCEIRTKKASVDLGTHELAVIRRLQNGDNFGSAQQSMTVDCPAGMNVNYTIADNNHPGNIGKDVILLENAGNNPGFGVQMFEAGSNTPLTIGGDRSNPLPAHQYLFAKTNIKQTINKEFEFRYVKLSDDVKAEEGNARVTVTLIYK